MKKFSLELKASADVFNGFKNVTVVGFTTMTAYINNPPSNGTCSIVGFDEKTEKWYDTNSGLALVQTFKLSCDLKWQDPEGHRITKFVYKCKEGTFIQNYILIAILKLLVQRNINGKISSLILSSGPLLSLIHI